MAKVMIKCPDTGKLVFTGVFGDKTLLESMQIKKNKMARCSACGKSTCGRKSKPFYRTSGSVGAIRVVAASGPRPNCKLLLNRSWVRDARALFAAGSDVESRDSPSEWSVSRAHASDSRSPTGLHKLSAIRVV